MSRFYVVPKNALVRPFGYGSLRFGVFNSRVSPSIVLCKTESRLTRPLEPRLWGSRAVLAICQRLFAADQSFPAAVADR